MRLDLNEVFYSYVCFERFLCVDLAVLEPTLWTRLTSNSEIHLLLPPLLSPSSGWSQAGRHMAGGQETETWINTTCRFYKSVCCGHSNWHIYLLYTPIQNVSINLSLNCLSQVFVVMETKGLPYCRSSPFSVCFHGYSYQQSTRSKNMRWKSLEIQDTYI